MFGIEAAAEGAFLDLGDGLFVALAHFEGRDAAKLALAGFERVGDPVEKVDAGLDL